MRKQTTTQFRLASFAMILCLLTALLSPAVPKAFAGKIGTRFLRLSSSLGGATATHLIGITYTDMANPVGSLVFEYCVEGPLPYTPCTAPTGLNVAGSFIASQTGETGYAIHANTTANRLVLSRSASIPVNPNSIYQLNSVINPDNVGSYYVRIYTHATDDGTGPDIDNGGMVFAITRALSVSAEVPPFLLFCTGVTIVNFDCSSAVNFLIDMGELSTAQTSSGTSEMVVATNAPYGYSITVAGTTLTSGNNVINQSTVPSVSTTGSSQYGLNLRANTTPSKGADPNGLGTGVPTNGYEIPNMFKFNSGDLIISSNTTSNYHKFTATYIANIDDAQAPGLYATTMSFIALGNF